ncbi:calcium-binding protein [Cypionkella sinensis]|uniref:Calcium-binding protein n=1 Tax=Cypionkella sinensis TaxID=1756043 RepID=A0ABV7JAX5_9RHOB
MFDFRSYGSSGIVVGEAMFGANCLFKYNLIKGNYQSYPQSLSLLHVTGLRYPGGSMTESDFDVRNPDSRPLTYTSDRPFVGISDFLNFVNLTGRSATIVLPTAKMYNGQLDASHDAPRAINQQYLKDVLSYVTKLLTHGDSGPGSLPDTPIGTIEIGNEYWGSGQMTAKEYGQLVNVLCTELEKLFDSLLGPNASHPQVLIQMGGPWDRQYKEGGLYDSLSWLQRVAQSNLDIIGQITNPMAKDAITGLVEHYYYDVASNVLSQTSAAMNYINVDLAYWSNNGFNGLDLYLTEWGIKSGNTVQYGLKGASVMIEQMQYMLQLGADGAFAWPVQNGQTSLTGSSSSAPALSPMGAAFMLMAEDLVGTTLINGTVGQTGLEVDAYKSSTKVVFFVMSRSDSPQDVELNVSSLVSGYTNITGVRIGIASGLAVDDPTAVAVLTTYTQQQLGRADHLSFHLEPFEVIEIEFEIPRNIRVDGTNFSERLAGGLGDDIINGLDGNDSIIGRVGHDILHGNRGNDGLDGWDGDDTIYGDDGNDRLGGQQGNDHLNGGSGNDVLQGGIGNDTAVYTSPSGVRINLSVVGSQDTGEGIDVLTSIENISSGSGSDRLIGNDVANYIESGAGNDTVFGGNGNDTVYGSYGNDLISGDAGDDRIYSEWGSDTVTGGLGKDILFGGSLDGVRDIFVFNNVSESGSGESLRDQIFDFASGIDDVDLSRIDANTQRAGDQSFLWSNTTAAANSVWYAVNGTNVMLRADNNGDSVYDFEVLLANITHLNSTDIIL